LQTAKEKPSTISDSGPQEPAATLTAVPSSATASVMAVNLGGEGLAEVAGLKNNLIDLVAVTSEEDDEGGGNKKAADTAAATDSREETVEANEEERRSKENADGCNK